MLILLLVLLLYILPIVACFVINMKMPYHEQCIGIQNIAFFIPVLNLIAVPSGIYYLGYYAGVASTGTNFFKSLKDLR